MGMRGPTVTDDMDLLTKTFPVASHPWFPIAEIGTGCLPGGWMVVTNIPKGVREINRRKVLRSGGFAPIVRG